MLKILYFARLRDEVGCSKELLQWQDHFASVNDIKTLLNQRGEPWQQAFSDNILHAVNQHVVQSDHAITDGDEIAFFPPVTGG
ncbi:molybdopterin converting factor subunit 1 [Candidatus Endobugula sertula]|uniref:Molybdopterin synthase sulfur carrier subunit n=1 Tax=Candidatus Endobugula sertula TaxID=62101 RepID=A0A1D2QTG9_9GAMM|nr:molybdopterin converting factor subunit 1 [Candidatus Endobugula sertula]